MAGKIKISEGILRTTSEAFYSGFGLGMLFVLFILFFFPWVGIYIGSTTREQSGIGVIRICIQNAETDLMVKSLSGTADDTGFRQHTSRFPALIIQLVDRYVATRGSKLQTTIQKVVSYQDTIVNILLIITHWHFLLTGCFLFLWNRLRG